MCLHQKWLPISCSLVEDRINMRKSIPMPTFAPTRTLKHTSEQRYSYELQVFPMKVTFYRNVSWCFYIKLWSSIFCRSSSSSSSSLSPPAPPPYSVFVVFFLFLYFFLSFLLWLFFLHHFLNKMKLIHWDKWLSWLYFTSLVYVCVSACARLYLCCCCCVCVSHFVTLLIQSLYVFNAISFDKPPVLFHCHYTL